jgi:serine/threonine-protein kinase
MTGSVPQQSFPERIGRYELLLPIGTGGMATVYLASTTGAGGFRREVALKLVHAHLRGDEESKLHLLEEARLAARIRHPNVVPVLEVEEEPLGIFLVMEYAEGETLAGLSRLARTADKKLEMPVLARILDDALSGLHAAHELCDENGLSLGLVHRDFSPQNILVDIEGVARLTDFGIAKASNRAVRTKTGLVKGKVSYMAPEQARGHELDRRCDVWAAGVVAWELISGMRLYRAKDEVATLLEIVTGHPPSLLSVVPTLPKGVSDAVASALTPSVLARCPTAEELRRRLETAWQEVGGKADRQTVARAVRELVGERLSERRRSIQEVQKLRARMGELVRPGMAEFESSPTGDTPLPAEPTPLPPVLLRKDAGSDRASDVTTADVQLDMASRRTDDTGITRFEVPLLKRAAWPLLAGAALLAFGLYWATTRGDSPSERSRKNGAPLRDDPAEAAPDTARGDSIEPEGIDSNEEEPDAVETGRVEGTPQGSTATPTIAPRAVSEKARSRPRTKPSSVRPKSTSPTPGAKPPSELAKDPYSTR